MLAKDTQLQRRTDYELASPGDRFIVKLLKKQIDCILDTYAKSDRSPRYALDVGCGCQPFRSELEALGYVYTSIDIQQNSKQNVDIICEIDRPLPAELLNRGSFDFILCTEVMEHVIDWDTSFQNFAKLLAPDGYLLITCPHFYQLHEEPYDFWRATPYALKHFGDKVGLKIVRQVNAGDGWEVLGTLLANLHTIPISSKFVDRAFNRIFRLVRDWVVNLLLNGYIQRYLSSVNSKVYQANIGLFQK